jgi:hypothetical protein
MMTRDQKIVGIGAASGVAAMIVAIAGTYQLWPSSPSGENLTFGTLATRQKPAETLESARYHLLGSDH